MLINLLYGLPAMGACLLLQSLLVIAAFRYYAHRRPSVRQSSFWPTMRVINGVMLILVIGNIAQVAIWALLNLFLGEFSMFGDAVYHSAVNFTTLGYGDIIMSEKHRLLGPLEAINGVLMIGVSTAVLMAFFQDAMKKTFLARRKK
ncbi:hypothetical protein DSCW_27640 [Desulfosarcina widdelii]|uniref:Potassium channel domain-containing protein n=1 Tax=Desulfosarcina widdelii TaxID=947919 RepID=A0A5K7ZGX3_9BACT|nr:potassium channel family protein [Desulfosarcina widdelii]BBO75347.1 hypothetical protein DSCW_27640 [Desulfosarcina widdelii]